MEKAMRHWAVCSALATLSLSCSPTSRPSLTEQDREAAVAAIEAIARSFAQNANALAVDQIASSFSKDAEFTWAGDGQAMLISSDSLMGLYRAIYRSYQKMDFVWDTMRVAIPSPDVGVLTGAAHFTVTDTAGHTVKQAAAVTYVFVRENGQWKLRHGHASHRVLPQ